MQLRLFGFIRQSNISIDDVVRLLRGLPAFHLEGLREITYLTAAEARMELLHAPPHDFLRRKGIYIQKERRIVLYGVTDPSLLYRVLFHEIGHHVFFLVISSVVKKHWVTEIFPHSAYVTPYARMNASEDFAESYACYLLDPETLKAIPAKYAFMRDHVFSGMPHSLKEKNK